MTKIVQQKKLFTFKQNYTAKIGPGCYDM